MRGVDLGLRGSPRNSQPLRPCQGACGGQQRVPEGGLQVGQRWVCARCSSGLLRRLR